MANYSTNNVYDGYFKSYFEVSNGNLELKGVPPPLSKNYYMSDFHQILGIRFLTKSHLIAHILKLIEKAPTHNHVEVKYPTMAILKAMDNFIKEKGAKFIIATTGYSQELENFSTKEKIMYIDLTNSYKYPRHGSHWTPQGHYFVAEKICNFNKK